MRSRDIPIPPVENLGGFLRNFAVKKIGYLYRSIL